MNKYLPLLAIAALFLFMGNRKKLGLRLKETSGAFDTLIGREELPDGSVIYWEFIVPSGQRPSAPPSVKSRVDAEDWDAATIL